MKIRFTAPTEVFPFYSDVKVNTGNGWHRVLENPPRWAPAGSGPLPHEGRNGCEGEAARKSRLTLMARTVLLASPPDRTPGPDFKQVFDFLISIEGAGYGGMAEFEIARETIRAALAELPTQRK